MPYNQIKRQSSEKNSIKQKHEMICLSARTTLQNGFFRKGTRFKSSIQLFPIVLGFYHFGFASGEGGTREESIMISGKKCCAYMQGFPDKLVNNQNRLQKASFKN
jgi:hypothetical protein